MEENNNIYSVNLIVENQLFASIRDQVICPICEELKLDAKSTTCPRNCQFSVCGDCAKAINKCPICNSPTGWNNCVVIRQLLPSLDFKCSKCRAIVHFDDLKDHYKNHEQNNINNNINSPVVLSDGNNQIGSREPIRNREIIGIRRPNNNNSINSENNSEKFNLCEFLKSDRFSKFINFYNIIFFIRTLCYLYFTFRIN